MWFSQLSHLSVTATAATNTTANSSSKQPKTTSIANILSSKIVSTLVFISILNVIHAAENRTNYVNNYTNDGMQSMRVNATAATTTLTLSFRPSYNNNTNEIWMPKGNSKNTNGK